MTSILKVDQLQDSGGNAIITSDGAGNITTPGITTYTNSDALTLFNASGSAPVYACRAWVNWDGASGAGTTIRGSGNVSSITYNGTGDYTVNFTTAMPDANYATSAFASQESSADNNVTCVGQKGVISSNYTVSSCRLQMRRLDGVTLDINLVTAIFVR